MKNLKYLFVVILILIMVPAANALTADELFEKESAQYTEHLEKINEVAKEKGITEITLENSGPVYSFDNRFDDKPFTEHLTFEGWRYYIKNGHIAIGYNPQTQQWETGTGASTQGGFGSAIDTEDAGVGYSYPDKDGKRVYVDLSLYGMCKTAAELTDNKADSVSYIDTDKHDFVYVTAEGEEYLIQYSSRPDLSGRENFKLYPFDEIYQEAKEKRQKQIEAIKNGEEMGEGGGSSFGTNASQESEEKPEEQQTEEAEQPDTETAGQPESEAEDTAIEQQPERAEPEPEYQSAEDDDTDGGIDKTIFIIIGIAVVIVAATLAVVLSKKRK